MLKSKSRKSVPKARLQKHIHPPPKPSKKPADKTQRKGHTISPEVSQPKASPHVGAQLTTNGQPHEDPARDAQTTAALGALGTIKSQSGVDLTEKIKELVRLAQEQGYLTYNDINDALPDAMITPEELDEIYIKLRNLEVEIVDQAEVDRVKQPEPEEEEDKTRLDILDDPVRMYLKQMGQVTFLTREQEVEISKRIEAAENELKRIIYGFGFSGKEHIALAEKLISEPPKERFDRVIIEKKIEGRDNHLEALRKLVKDVRVIDQFVDDKYAEWQVAPSKARRDKSQREFKKLDDKLQRTFPKYYYKQKVIEEMALVADNIHDKIQLSLRTIQDLECQRKSTQQQGIIQSEQKKIKSLEEFVRMPFQDYLTAYEQLQHFAKKALQAKTEMVEANLRLVISIAKNN